FPLAGRRGGRARRAAPSGTGADSPEASGGVLPARPGGVELQGDRPAPGGLRRCRRRAAAPGPGSAATLVGRPARSRQGPRPLSGRGWGVDRPPQGIPMSAIPPPPQPDDPLARAEEALRDTPVPDGPSEETIARTLAALRAADERPWAHPLYRRR